MGILNNPEFYKTIKTCESAELTEKNSRFISYTQKIKTEDDAQRFIAGIKSEHFNARHTVFAYVLRREPFKRYSDDGEPSGTAGMPILNLIEKSGLYDTCVAVTRYFGGVLLGTGGLLRAYTGAAKLALASSGEVIMTLCKRAELTCSYSRYETVQKIIGVSGGFVEACDFYENVGIKLFIPQSCLKALQMALTEYSGGEIILSETGADYYNLCS